MSNNLDNLLTDIYSSDNQSQGVKELANLINNLSNLLLKAISQLEGRVTKLEQQVSRGGGTAPSSPVAPSRTPAPMPKTASPFSPATPVRSTPPPPPPQQKASPSPAAASTGGGPTSAAQAAAMLGATLKPAPKKTTTPAAGPSAAAPAASSSGPSFLTGVVDPNAKKSTSPSSVSTVGGPSAAAPDAMAPASTGGGIAGPAGGFKGELAEKLARRRQKVQQQLEDDFDAPDLAVTPEEEDLVEEDTSASSELKLDLEDELRNAFSKLKG